MDAEKVAKDLVSWLIKVDANRQPAVDVVSFLVNLAFPNDDMGSSCNGMNTVRLQAKATMFISDSVKTQKIVA